MTDGEVKALLAAAEDAEEKCREYSRRVALFGKLALALYMTAAMAYALSTALYLMHGWWQIVAAGTAIWTAGYASYMLHVHYSKRAADAAKRACMYRRIAEVIIEIHRLRSRSIVVN
jgi:hypothetical protein